MRRIDPEAYPEVERPIDLAQQEAAIQASLAAAADPVGRGRWRWQNRSGASVGNGAKNQAHPLAML